MQKFYSLLAKFVTLLILTNAIEIHPESRLNATGYDAVLIVTHDLKTIENIDTGIYEDLQNYMKLDASTDAAFLLSDKLPGKRLIVAKAKEHIYRDVRVFKDAAAAGFERLKSSGAKSLLLAVPKHDDMVHAQEVAIFSILSELFIPSEVIEMRNRTQEIEKIGIFDPEPQLRRITPDVISKLEEGRSLMRDIVGGDAERMTPPAIADLITATFRDTPVKVQVHADQEYIKQQYPGVEAVNRGCNGMEKYKAQVVKLAYEPPDGFNETIMIVGKGVTFDTGGHNLKSAKGMIKMRKDKGGAAAVYGFFKALASTKPRGIRVLGTVPLVRNCIGPAAYLPTELIKLRSGKIVRVTNTDAEGRMIMVDPMTEFNEMAKAMPNNNFHLYTMATLTGSARYSCGNDYACILDSRSAEKENLALKIAEAGAEIGEPLEVGKLRFEDFKNMRDDSMYADLRNTGKERYRGYQSAFAFLLEGSGILQDEEANLNTSLPVTHIDMCATDIVPLPNAHPLLAMIWRIIVPNL